jgi:hypothetical protein
MPIPGLYASQVGSSLDRKRAPKETPGLEDESRSELMERPVYRPPAVDHHSSGWQPRVSGATRSLSLSGFRSPWYRGTS